MLQALIPNRGDGWQWFLNELLKWLAGVADRPSTGSTQVSGLQGNAEATPEDLVAAHSTLEAAALLGRCTAEMHLALSISADLPAFAPEPMREGDLARDAERIEAQIRSTLEALKLKLATLDDAAGDDDALLLSRRTELIRRARSIAALEASGQKIRIHGDYHLGQTLRTAKNSQSLAGGGDFVLIDFEGEPARPIEERRGRQSPLKDVAGMIRSFSYAAYAAVDHYVTSDGGAREHPDSNALSGWAQWWQTAASARFLRAYGDAAASNPALLPGPETAKALLEAYLLEKALYEVLYELNHRPAWRRIPINGILAL